MRSKPRIKKQYLRGKKMKANGRGKSGVWRWGIPGILFFLMIGPSAMAADVEAAKTAESGITRETGITGDQARFEVVAGTNEMAYLVDKTTGAVWVLTYRTMATGREPIAIPYKFILRTPKDQGEFLLESPTSVSLPPSGGK